MANSDTAPAPGTEEQGGRPAGETSTPAARDPQVPATAAHTVEAEKRARWEKAAAKAAVEKYQAEIAARLGGASLDDVLSEWQAVKAEREKLAEQSATEVQKVSKKAAAAEAKAANLEARIATYEAELREHRLERPLRELVQGVQVRKPQYAAVLLGALKSRFALDADGRTVRALGADGQIDNDLKPESVLSEIVAQYPDLVTTPMPGHGSGPGQPAQQGPANGSAPKTISRDEESRIYGNLLRRT